MVLREGITLKSVSLNGCSALRRRYMGSIRCTIDTTDLTLAIEMNLKKVKLYYMMQVLLEA